MGEGRWHGVDRLRTLWSCVRHAVRRVSRARRFSLTVILVLSLSVGAVVTLAAVLEALVFRVLPVSRPQELVAVYPVTNAGLPRGIPYATLSLLAESQGVVAGLCGLSVGTARLGTPGAISNLAIEGYSGTCYDMLGVRPHAGRLLSDHDAALDAEPTRVAVLSYAFWQREFGGSLEVLGTDLLIEGTPLTIVGIAPQTFRGLHADRAPDIVVPLTLIPKLIRTVPMAFWGVGRLTPGVALAAANVELLESWPRVWQTSTTQGASSAVPDLRIEPLSRGLSELRPRYQRALEILAGLSLLMLVLASFNLGGLFLAYFGSERNGIRLMAALGATSGRLNFELAVTGATLGLLGGLGALGIAWLLTLELGSSFSTGRLPLTVRLTPGPALLGYALVGSAAVGAFLMVPVLVTSRFQKLNLSTIDMKTIGRASSRWRSGLVVGQGALSLSLLACAGLLATNMMSLRAIDPGYQAAGLWYTRLEVLPLAPPLPEVANYLRQMADEIRAVPRTQSAAMAARFPTVDASSPPTPLSRRDPLESAQPEALAGWDYVSPGFFETAGIKLLEGRDFRWDDTVNRPSVVVLNKTLASTLFPDHSAVGSTVYMGKSASTVIGVVADASLGDPRLATKPVVYSSLLKYPNIASSIPYLLVRTSEPGRMADGLQAAVRSQGRHYTATLTTVESQIDTFFTREKMLASVSGRFAGLGLLISSVGLFALLTQSVEARRREIALRVALGASENKIVQSIIGQVALLTIAGGALAAPVLWLASRPLSIVAGGSLLQPNAIGFAWLSLAIATCLAAAVPCYRILTTPTAQVLRE